MSKWLTAVILALSFSTAASAASVTFELIESHPTGENPPQPGDFQGWSLYVDNSLDVPLGAFLVLYPHSTLETFVLNATYPPIDLVNSTVIEDVFGDASYDALALTADPGEALIPAHTRALIGGFVGAAPLVLLPAEPNLAETLYGLDDAIASTGHSYPPPNYPTVHVLVIQVPEPAGLALAASALVALRARRRLPRR